MKITKTIVINKPINDVWNLIAHDFEQAHLWMSPVPHSYAIGKGNSTTGAPMEGRICQFSDKPDGDRAKEMITQYNEKERRITFEVTSINVPAIVPIKKMSSKCRSESLIIKQKSSGFQSRKLKYLPTRFIHYSDLAYLQPLENF